LSPGDSSTPSFIPFYFIFPLPFLAHATGIARPRLYLLTRRHRRPPSDRRLSPSLSAAADLFWNRYLHPCHIAPPAYSHPLSLSQAAAFAKPISVIPLSLPPPHLQSRRYARHSPDSSRSVPAAGRQSQATSSNAWEASIAHSPPPPQRNLGGARLLAHEGPCKLSIVAIRSG
jgi:hypothetical protein